MRGSRVQFPFFCSDREYIIGRRIWASGKTFYCVTKVWNEIASLLLIYMNERTEFLLPVLALMPIFFSLQGVPRPSVPRQNKPRRVDLYYSSWCIRPGNYTLVSQQ
jgi:hypothetical protein